MVLLATNFFFKTTTVALLLIAWAATKVALSAADSSLTPPTSHWEKVKKGVVESSGLIRGLMFRMGPSTKEIPRRGLSVIGAGMSRTGTKSISEALSTLGYCIYDLRAIMELGHERRWLEVTKAWKEDANLQPMATLLDEIESLGYSATMDTPLNFMAPALMQLRPKAKVVYSRQDSAEKWYQSYVFIVEFIEGWECGRPWKFIFPKISQWMHPIMLLVLPFSFEDSTGPCRSNRFDRVLPWYDRMETTNSPWRTNPIIKEHWIQLYNDIPKQLKEAMGCKEQEDCHNLLEFNVKQGWRPLLEFLDIHDEKLAQEPFPYVVP